MDWSMVATIVPNNQSDSPCEGLQDVSGPLSGPLSGPHPPPNICLVWQFFGGGEIQKISGRRPLRCRLRRAAPPQAGLSRGGAVKSIFDSALLPFTSKTPVLSQIRGTARPKNRGNRRE